MTTSLDISKELKKRGVRGHWIGRPSLEELIKVMPDEIKTNGIVYSPLFDFGDFDTGREYWFGYAEREIRTNIIGYQHNQSNPADCVAKCLIFLIDNKYVSVKGGEICLDK